MKSAATTRSVSLLGMAALLMPFLALRADTTCECPTPPGGKVTCPDNNLAMCVVKDGKATSNCAPIPEAVKKNQEALDAWVLTKVLKRKIEPADAKKEEHQAILKKGRYENKTTGEVITFRLPKVK
jgi:hypothetical protein